MPVEVWAINSKIAKCYELIMIYKCFYKCEARVENYDHYHCYASCDIKIEKKKYYTIDQTRCGYCGSNEISTNAVRYWVNLVETGKVWSI